MENTITKALIIEADIRCIPILKRILKRIHHFESLGYSAIGDYPRNFTDLVEKFDGVFMVMLEHLKSKKKFKLIRRKGK